MIHVPALMAALAAASQAEGPQRAEAAGNLAQHFSYNDYPTEALRRGAQGTVAFRLDIDATGTPTGCTIEQSSGDSTLDQATCDIARTRARFRPARDAQGRPVPDTHSARVTWQIQEASTDGGKLQRARPTQELASLFSNDDYPPAALRRGAQGLVSFRLEIDMAGVPTSCTIVTSSGEPELDQATCDIARARARFHPARDGKGRVVADTHFARVVWRIEDSPHYPYAPQYQVTIMSFPPSGPVCTWQVDGETIARPGEDVCSDTFGPLVQLFRGSMPPVEIIHVAAFTPSGQPPFSPRSAEYGELISKREAELIIAPDGSVERCRILSSQSLDIGDLVPPDPCDGHGSDGQFEPVIEGDERRGGRLYQAFFVRRRITP